MAKPKQVDADAQKPEVQKTDELKTDVQKTDVRKAKKQFLTAAIVIGALIVILVISIIAIAISRGQNAPDESQESAEVSSATEEGDREGYILTDAELDAEYNKIAGEIAEAMLTASENGQGFDGISQMYLDKINATEDVRLKAMLETDYYFLRFSQSPTEELKNEILNNLMRIDGILKTPASAYNVVNIASFYNEQEMVNYYTNLAIERGDAEATEAADDEGELETAG